MMIAPAFFQLATTGLSAVAMTSLNAATPLTVAQPSWSTFSLIVTGTPCSGPNAAPLRNRGVGAIRRGQRLAGKIAGHGIQLRVDRPHPPDAGVHGFARRNRTRADAFGERNGIPLPQFVGHVAILVPDARADTCTHSDLPFICHAAR